MLAPTSRLRPQAQPPSGYRHSTYPAAIGEPSTIIELPRSGGWLLRNNIAQSGFFDAVAPYPLLCCAHWERLADDLDALGDELVSVTAVTDPFADIDRELLAGAFTHLVQPFKQHYVVDLASPTISSHHRRNIRRSTATVVRLDVPGAYVDDWVLLYQGLVQRHGIRGTANFSAESLAKQLCVHGVEVFAAYKNQKIVAMQLWLQDGEHAYYHLGASSDAGYENRASFALFAAAIDHFAGCRLRWLDLGGHAGLKENAADGLARFKAGWASTELPVYLCGRVCNVPAYQQLTSSQADSRYFPTYRTPAVGVGL